MLQAHGLVTIRRDHDGCGPCENGEERGPVVQAYLSRFRKMTDSADDLTGEADGQGRVARVNGG
jgi:hypothetical protein